MIHKNRQDYTEIHVQFIQFFADFPNKKGAFVCNRQKYAEKATPRAGEGAMA